MKKKILLRVIPLLGLAATVYLFMYARGNSNFREPFVDHEFRQIWQLGGSTFGVIQYPKGAWMADTYREFFTSSQLEKSGTNAIREDGSYAHHFSVHRRMGTIILFGQNIPLLVRAQLLPLIFSGIFFGILWLAFRLDGDSVEQVVPLKSDRAGA